LLAKDKAGAVISLNKHCYKAGEMINVIIVPDFETETLVGSLVLSRLDRDAKKLIPVGVQKEVSARGGRLNL
jgi:hypothetical protein